MKFIKFIFFILLLFFFPLIIKAKTIEYNSDSSKINNTLSDLKYKNFNNIKNKKSLEYFVTKYFLIDQKKNILNFLNKEYENTIYYTKNLENEHTIFLENKYSKELYFYFDKDISRINVQDFNDNVFFLKKINNNIFFLESYNKINFYKINFFSHKKLSSLNLYISENLDNDIIFLLKQIDTQTKTLEINSLELDKKGSEYYYINFFTSLVFFYFNILICSIFFKKFKNIILPIKAKYVYYIFNFILISYFLIFLLFDKTIYNDLFLIFFFYLNLFIFRLNKYLLFGQLFLFYSSAIYFYFYSNFIFFKLFEILSYIIIFSLISFLFLYNNYIFFVNSKLKK